MSKKKANTGLRPRNPLVAVAHLRHAGSHRSSNKAQRAQQKRETQRALQNNGTYSAGEFAFAV